MNAALPAFAETPAQQRAQRQALEDRRARERRGAITGIILERGNFEREGNTAAARDCDVALAAWGYDPAVDVPDLPDSPPQPTPTEVRETQAAVDRAEQGKLSHARGIRGELAEAEATGDREKAQHCEDQLRSLLELPADADVHDLPAADSPAPFPPGKVKRVPRLSAGLRGWRRQAPPKAPTYDGIEDPTKKALEAKRVAEGKAATYDPDPEPL